MIKQEVTYRDFMGTERTEEFYFNISMNEALKWETSTDGGVAEKIRKIINASDHKEVISTYEEFILIAYGEIANDGRSFLKYDENGRRLSDKFKQTAAYDALLTELLFDQKKAEAFVSGVVDPELARRMKEYEQTGTVKPLTPSKQVVTADFGKSN